jgi:GTPase SAR1 family protein
MYDNLIRSFYIELNRNMTDDLVIHVVGNKIDLESQRQVSFAKVCNKLTNCVNGVHEVSAKTNQGIYTSYYKLIFCANIRCKVSTRFFMKSRSHWSRTCMDKICLKR